MKTCAVGLLVSCLGGLSAETITAFGDSLTAGYGVDEDQAWPALVSRALATSHPTWRVINAGVSGETTAGGLRRIAWALKAKPEVVLIALGANDGLRGQDLATAADNLTRIIATVRAAGARPVLVGQRIPTSLGQDYTTAFAALYPTVAAAEQVPLLPFLLEGVAGDSALNAPDGIHPNVEGHQRIAQTVVTFLTPLLEPR